MQKINGLSQINEIKKFELNILENFDEEKPFVDTAIIENLDLVITCDTSVAHLSGAIEKNLILQN